MLPIHSLRTKLTLSHALVVLVAVVLVGLLSSLLVSRGLQQLAQAQARRDAAQIAEVLSRLAASPLTSDRPLRAIRRQLAAPDQPALLRGSPFVLADAQAQVILDRGGSLEGQPLPAALRRNAAPITVANRIVGFVALPVERRVLNLVERQVVLRIYAGVVGSSLLAGLLAVGIGLVMARRQTRPLRALTLAARQLAQGNRHEPVAVATRDELGELALAFNTMAHELAHQQQLRRNLVADIAHELRTPLSVLQLQAEALHDGVAPPIPATFASLVEEVGLLNRLVDDLRVLSLADAGQLAVTTEAVDPAAIAERTMAAAQPHAQAQQIALCCEVARQLPAVQADPQRLAQVLGAVLDNALRYTPPGGSVVLRVEQVPLDQAPASGVNLRSTAYDRRDAEPQRNVSGSAPARLCGDSEAWVRFTVSDSGPGIAPADLPHVFERFYRADRARARATGGSGLGLAIAQRLVVAMHGQIWAESLLGSGARFFVALPAQTQSVERRT